MQIVIAADHGGFEYKQQLVAWLPSMGFSVHDLGANDATASDYPDHAASVAAALQNDRAERGIVICGSGAGVSVAANKFRGIRACLCHDTYTAHQCVEHDAVNVLCIGQRVIGIELAKEIVLVFLGAKYSGEERHQRRLDKVLAIERQQMTR